jgi:hypothetical protein
MFGCSKTLLSGATAITYVKWFYCKQFSEHEQNFHQFVQQPAQKNTLASNSLPKEAVIRLVMEE